MSLPPDARDTLRTDLAPVALARPGRRIAAVVVALLAAGFIHTCLANPNFQWSVVGKYLFNKEILAGVRLTIELTLSAMAIGVALGLVTALMRLSDNRLLSGAAVLYIVVFRGIPALVQLIFWYNLAALFPRIAIGIPFFGPEWFSVNANAIITPTAAANLGLGLCEGAYMAEIVRAGLMSVDPGQREAGASLGLTRAQTMRRVILPQALRVIVPPTGNEIIGMLKLSSLASVISVTELLAAAGLIYTRTFETIPLLIVASMWYIALTGVLTLGQRFIERRLGRSVQDVARGGRA
ncbi:MAG TPA: amino acid ABC transporter permease [Casimicrobiaceae bacterium]